MIHQLDITREVCPMTYVRTKVRLEELSAGEELEVLFRGEEPLNNLPRNAKDDGHEVVSLEALGADRWRMIIRRGPDAH